MDTQEFKRQCDNGRSDFSGENLKGIRLWQFDLSGFKFPGATLDNPIILETNLTNSEFQDAKIRDADFTNSNFILANLNNAQITGTDLSGAKLNKADLIKASITKGSVLQRANLTEARLIRADLCSSDLSYANLSGANLTQVQAFRTKFTNATFTGACIKDWHWNHTTNFENIEFDYFCLEPPHIDKRKLYYANGRSFASAYYQVFLENFISKVKFLSGLEIAEILSNFIKNIEQKSKLVAIQAFLENLVNTQQLRYKTKDSINVKYFSSCKISNEKNTVILIIDEYFKNKYQFYADEKVEINNPILQTLFKDNIFIASMSTDKQQNNKKYQAQGGDGSQNVAADRINLQDSSKIENNHSNSGDRNNEDIQEITEKLNQILQEIEKSHDINTTAGKMKIATGAIEKIESDRPLKTKVVSAVKSGGTAALAQFLSHPAASFVIEAFNDWQK